MSEWTLSSNPDGTWMLHLWRGPLRVIDAVNVTLTAQEFSDLKRLIRKASK